MSLLLDGQAPVTPASRHLAHLTRILPLVALGLFAADDYATASTQGIHALRFAAVAVGGMVPHGITQPVFVEGAQDAVRTDHSLLHRFRGATPAAPAQSTPWFIYNKPAARIDDENDVSKADTSLLHRFRAAQQAAPAQVTPWFQYAKPYRVADQDEDYRRVANDTLHAYRAVTVEVDGMMAHAIGQPVFVDADKDAKRSDHSLLHRFRSVTVAPPAQSTPWFQYLKPTRYQDAEDDAPRVNTGALHAFRGIQVLITRVWALEDARNRIEEEPYTTPKPVDLALFRNTAPAAPAAGQTWPRWIKPQVRIDEEPYSIPKPVDLLPFRQITIPAIPGQPWFMWPKAVADQTVEPNPVVINHAQLMYAFRPHEAIEPVIPPVVDASEPWYADYGDAVNTDSTYTENSRSRKQILWEKTTYKQSRIVPNGMMRKKRFL